MVLLHTALVAAAAAAPPTRSFQLGGALNNSFSKDGLPFTFMAGSMHYWRSKPSEWRPKLKLMRELGLNSVLTPTIWARHEALEEEIATTSAHRAAKVRRGLADLGGGQGGGE